jgi:hypothetical protein
MKNLVVFSMLTLSMVCSAQSVDSTQASIGAVATAAGATLYKTQQEKIENLKLQSQMNISVTTGTEFGGPRIMVGRDPFENEKYFRSSMKLSAPLPTIQEITKNLNYGDQVTMPLAEFEKAKNDQIEKLTKKFESIKFQLHSEKSYHSKAGKELSWKFHQLQNEILALKEIKPFNVDQLNSVLANKTYTRAERDQALINVIKEEFRKGRKFIGIDIQSGKHLKAITLSRRLKGLGLVTAIGGMMTVSNAINFKDASKSKTRMDNSERKIVEKESSSVTNDPKTFKAREL